MASQTFEQFVRFSTDSAGLERLLRLVQAAIQIFTSYPLLLSLAVSLVATGPGGNKVATSYDVAKTQTVLVALRSRVALARRFFRLFRFLDSFHAAYGLYASLSAPPAGDGDQQGFRASQRSRSNSGSGGVGGPLETWLDILSRTLNGAYLFLESATLVDALDVPGLSVWGPATAGALHVEAQRFWFLALVAGVGSGAVKLVKVFAYAPVPETGEGYGTGEKAAGEKGGDEDGGDSSTKDEGTAADWRAERERMRRALRQRRAQMDAWRRSVRSKSRTLLRRLAADGLDLFVPGSVVGWVDAAPGTVGIAMLGSTILTGLEVWERCGSEVRKG